MSIDTNKNEVKKMTFQAYLSDKEYKFVRWAPKRNDSMDYNLVCEINLSRGNTVQYWYHEQCLYEYFIYETSDNTIDVEYTFKSDCMLNLDFLEKSNGAKKHSKLRNHFATYHLVNDTTIQVEYFFPEWAKSSII